MKRLDRNWMAMSFPHPVNDFQFFSLVMNLLNAGVHINLIDLPPRCLVMVTWKANETALVN